jgi:hypothetical protein
LDSAEQIAEKSLRPLLFKMDRNEPHLIDDQIRIHPGIKAIIRKFGEDGCEGYLVGEVNQGLKYMFQMMNEARLGVGMNAVGIASAAYQDSLAYAKERPQGRKVTEKSLSQPQVPIIEHADVKRMLLFQKSVEEGSLALLIYSAIGSDKISQEADPVKKREQEALLDLLTPIAKAILRKWVFRVPRRQFRFWEVGATRLIFWWSNITGKPEFTRFTKELRAFMDWIFWVERFYFRKV